MTKDEVIIHQARRISQLEELLHMSRSFPRIELSEPVIIATTILSGPRGVCQVSTTELCSLVEAACLPPATMLADILRPYVQHLCDFYFNSTTDKEKP